MWISDTSVCTVNTKISKHNNRQALPIVFFQMLYVNEKNSPTEYISLPDKYFRAGEFICGALNLLIFFLMEIASDRSSIKVSNCAFFFF